jgi:hypothetical protein
MRKYLNQFDSKNPAPSIIRNAKYPWVMVRSVHYYPDDKFDYERAFEKLYFYEGETESHWAPVRNYDWILVRDDPQNGYKKGDLYFEVTG